MGRNVFVNVDSSDNYGPGLYIGKGQDLAMYNSTFNRNQGGGIIIEGEEAPSNSEVMTALASLDREVQRALLDAIAPLLQTGQTMTAQDISSALAPAPSVLERFRRATSANLASWLALAASILSVALG